MRDENLKSADVDINDWQPLDYEIEVQCPYCNEYTNCISLTAWHEDDEETFECDNCGKLFYINSCN